MNRNTRGWMYLLFAVLIMCITLGYAYLNTELDINGTTNITSSNCEVSSSRIHCSASNLYITAKLDGYVDAEDSTASCQIHGTGYSNCNIAFVG